MNITINSQQLTVLLLLIRDAHFSADSFFERNLILAILEEMKISLMQRMILQKSTYRLQLKTYQVLALHKFLRTTAYTDNHMAVIGNMLLGTLDKEVTNPTKRHIYANR